MSADTSLKSVLERQYRPKVLVSNVRRVQENGTTIARFGIEIDGWGSINNWFLAARKSDGVLFVSGPITRNKNGRISGHCYPHDDVRDDILAQVMAALGSAAL